MQKFVVFFYLVVSMMVVSANNNQNTLIHAGQLLAVAGDSVKSEQSIFVQDGKIVSIQVGYKDLKDFPENTQIIDLKDSFVMAGLMDMHVHLQFELGPHNTRDGLKMSEQLSGLRSAFYAKNTLLSGFTTVRDLGSDPQYMYALRDAINKGWLDGPRIIAAGGVGITGGHADISGVKPELMKLYTKQTICDGPYDCRRATRRAIKFGADVIKITSTGGVMTDRNTGTGQQMEMDELKEVVLAAKRMGRKVASHAHHESGIIAALEAGVDSIEHGSYTGPKAIKLFKKSGAYLVPTLLAGETVVKMAKNSKFMSKAIRTKAIRVGSDMKGSFSKAYAAGVKVAYGTDSGISRHGTNAEEAILMFDAGMPAMDILKSATVNAADLIGMSDTLGTLELGKQADIIAMNKSPLDDIKALTNISFVMRDGKVHKQ